MLKFITTKDVTLNRIAEQFAAGTISPATAVSMLQDPADLDRLLSIIEHRMNATTNVMKAMLKKASVQEHTA